MNRFLKVTIAGLAVIAIGAIGLVTWRGGLATGPGMVSATQSPGTDPSSTLEGDASALGDPAAWPRFHSQRYGLELGYPTGWTARPASRDWSMSSDVDDVFGVEGASDVFQAPDDSTVITAFAEPVGAGTALDGWLGRYLEGDACVEGTDPSEFDEVDVDSYTGTLVIGCMSTQAFVLVDDHVYAFSVWRPGRTELLHALLSTVRLQGTEPSRDPGG